MPDPHGRSGASARRPAERTSAELVALERAFARAEFAIVRILLDVISLESAADLARAELVRARLARIDGDTATWYAAAARAERGFAAPRERLYARALKAAAARRGGSPGDDGVTELAAVARAAASSAPATAGRATYLVALEAWQDGDLERAERLAARNVAAGVELPDSRALIGWIAIKAERFRDAGDHFEAALDALERSSETDERHRAKLVHAVANVAAETVDLERGARARAAYARVRWTSDLATDRVVALTPLRYLALLAGDFDEAWDVARCAATLLLSGPYAVMGETGEAFVHEVLGDRGATAIGLKRAWQLARDVRWGSATRAERAALADYAMTAAATMPAEARQAATIYRSLAAVDDPLSSLDDDRRIRAFELMASGHVNEVLGAPAAAVDDYVASLALWRELSHDLRVAQVAARLVVLTRDDAYGRLGRAALERAPNAWLGAVLRAPEGPVAALRPSERRVLEHLLRGESAKTIAETLGRSPHTISNHTRKVFQAFGVTSRARLLARYAELGSAPVTTAAVPRRRAGAPAKEPNPE